MAKTGLPNILFLFPDQWRADWLGMNGDVPVRTPTLDRLAERGVRFTEAVSPSPLCAPCRASLASGKIYDRCGVPSNGQDYPLDQPTFYQALRDRGYRVCGVGKFDLHKATLDWNLDGSRLLDEWGFTEGVDNEGKFDGSRSYARMGEERTPKGPYLKALAEAGVADAYVREHDASGANKRSYVSSVPDDLYCDNWLSASGLRFLRDFPEDAPWFLQVNFTGPHDPMDVTADMAALYDGVDFPMPICGGYGDDWSREEVQRNRRYYAAMCENIDRLCGRFIEAVSERGELDNTLVVFSSDHGEMLGDRGRGGKGVWWYGSAEAPCIVAGPDTVRGAVNSRPVSIHDFCATFLDYADADPLPGMDARSLRPVLTGETERVRDTAVSGLDGWRMIVDDTYKLVLRADGPPLLFDREADPYEENDIAAAHPETVERLAAALREQCGRREG